MAVQKNDRGAFSSVPDTQRRAGPAINVLEHESVEERHSYANVPAHSLGNWDPLDGSRRKAIQRETDTEAVPTDEAS